MKRRALLASALAVLAAQPAWAQQTDAATLTQIEAYLNSIRTLKAHFLQVAPDGRISQGTVWLERPGRMRFAYDPPTPLLLVAGNGMLVFHDSQLGQTSNIPLSQTPLGILLADQVRLSGPVKVTSLQRLPGMITVTVVRSASPGDGSLSLVFADSPLALRQWSVIDAQRQETRVTLSDVQLGGHFKDSLFDFIDRSFPNGAPLQGGSGG
ncbi:MAG: outer-membrane lipoprotein carrier protein LolA [Alphaproteobacteria bacterium]|nr:outer-membrane lipoprotein carrier protein LolA [Alphaproteobacteria bacterium]